MNPSRSQTNYNIKQNWEDQLIRLLEKATVLTTIKETLTEEDQIKLIEDVYNENQLEMLKVNLQITAWNSLIKGETKVLKKLITKLDQLDEYDDELLIKIQDRIIIM